MSPNERKIHLEVEDEQTLLETRVGDVVSARVANRRTGSTARFYRFDFSNWVNVIALTPEADLVLVKQFRFGSGRVELEIPGGAVEEGESPLDAGLRELREETGYRGKNGRVIGKVCPNPALQHNWCYTVLVEQAEQVGQQHLDEMEDIEVVTMSWREVDALVSSGKICHGLVLNALMFYERHLKKER